MKLSFDQDDLVKAMHEYVQSQGISTSGKSVDIKFTTTRNGKSGPSTTVATVTIEDVAGLPDLSVGAQVERPSLAVVKVEPTVAADLVAHKDSTGTITGVGVEQVDPSTATAKSTSLFG